MNERLLNIIPRKIIRKLNSKRDLKKEIVKYKKLQKLGEEELLDPNDWKLIIEEKDDGSFYCNFVECGAYKILKKCGFEYVFPCACRLDYLMTNIFGEKFERTKTIGDGDECCNNHYFGKGYTEWAPEKGFITRK